MLSAICFNLDQSKILSSGNGLMALEINANEKIVDDSMHFRLFM